jgi:hypothetical protein
MEAPTTPPPMTTTLAWVGKEFSTAISFTAAQRAAPAKCSLK